MSKLRVGVIRGGVSTEREVSLKTGSEIVANLNRDKYEVFDIVIDTEKEVYEKIKDLNLDFAYIALHGVFGEDGRIQAILESLGIAYSGPGVMSSALCMDKELTKKIVETYGVRTAKHTSFRVGQKAIFPKELGEKVIVKPNSGGSSIGISFATNEKELELALKKVYETDNEALVEEVLNGIEISVPIISGKVYPPVRIDALKSTYFDYNSKYDKDGANEYVYFFEEELQNEIRKEKEEKQNIIKLLNKKIEENDKKIETNIPVKLSKEQEMFKIELEEENYIENMWNEYQITLNNIDITEYEEYYIEKGLQTRDIEGNIMSFDIIKAKKILRDLKSSIKDLGEVDTSIIKEYLNTKERYDYLLNQREDLETSKKSLEKIIKEIAFAMEEQFVSRMDIINKNFKEIFVTLFGGRKC